MSFSEAAFNAEATTHVKPGAICVNGSPISIVEADAGGAGTITVTSSQSAIKLSPTDLATQWLVNQQCADGAVILFGGGEATLHIFELKSKLSTQKWDDAVSQCEGMIRRANALRACLGLTEYSDVTFYLAYKVDALTPYIQANPILLKSLLGGGSISSSLTSWLNKVITMPNFPDVPVVLVVRDAQGDGAIEIAA